MPHPVLAKGAVAVITGGASGIGLAATRAFAARGMTAIVADKKGLGSVGDGIVTIETDIADSSVEAWQALLGVNLWDVIHGTQAFVPTMLEGAAGDLIENRPPLSRWHPDWTEKLNAFVKAGQ